MKLDLVLRDYRGGVWVRTGRDRYTQKVLVATNSENRWSRTTLEERLGPTTVVSSIEIEGELATAPYSPKEAGRD